MPAVLPWLLSRTWLLLLSVAAALHGRPPAPTAAEHPALHAPAVASLGGLDELQGEVGTLLRDPLQLPATTRLQAPDLLELYHLRYESVDHAGQSRQVIQRVWEIRSSAGAAMPGVDDVWYDGSRWRFQLLHAEVWSGGRLVGMGRDQGDQRGSGNRPRLLTFPPLAIGDRVNLVYALLPLTGNESTALLGAHYLGDLFAFRGAYPVERVRYVLRSDHALALGQTGLGAPHESRDGIRRTWVWESGPLAAFFADPDGPSVTDRSPFVQVSDFAGWGDLANWYGAVLARRAVVTPKLRQQWLRLAPPRPTVAATVQAVWSVLAPRLRYLGNEEGLHAFVPDQVGHVFAARGGDCKDGALLLVTWLRAEGVEADVALVRTRALGRVAPQGATLAAFDHALVYVPALAAFLDTTAPEARLGELPTSDQGGLALILRPHESGLRFIPLAAPAENRLVRRVRLAPRDGGWTATGEITLQGADAVDARRRDADPAAARRQLTTWLRQRFTGARLESVDVHGLESSTIRITFRAWLPGRSWDGQGNRVAWSPRQYVAALASEASRDEVRRLPLLWDTEESWTQKAPDHCSNDRATPMFVRHQSRFGSFQADGICHQGWWTVTSRVEQTATHISAAEYPAYRRFWASADSFLNGSAQGSAGVEFAGR